MRLIRVRDPKEAFVRIRSRADDLGPLLKRIGALLVSASQRAFDDQRLGEIRWEPRYPNQSAPFLNIAGAVADLNAGGAIKARRFENRPALRDTGGLQQSIAWRIVGEDGVEAGSVLPYASVHQFGGESLTPVTTQAKRGIAKFLKTDRGRQFRDKVGWLLNRQLDVTELATQIGARPFLGISDDTEEEIADLVEDFFAEAA